MSDSPGRQGLFVVQGVGFHQGYKSIEFSAFGLSVKNFSFAEQTYLPKSTRTLVLSQVGLCAEADFGILVNTHSDINVLI